MGNYIYKLEEDFIYHSEIKQEKDQKFLDDKSKMWLEIKKDGMIIVKKGYAWNGCSPKVNILDVLMLGTPEGILDIYTMKPKTYYASLVHDALYQFMHDGNMKITRKQMDGIMLKLMEKTNFIPRHAYYFFVRAVGWIFRIF